MARAAADAERSALREWLRTGHVPEPRSAAEASALSETAAAQGLAGLLNGAVEHAVAWRPAFREPLRDAHRRVAARSTRQLDLAARVGAALDRMGLRALPLKGAALLERAYAVGERPMADVDLLVLDDFAGAVAVAAELGLTERERGDHAWTFVEPASGLWLELHHAPTSCAGLFAMDGEGLWRRRVPGVTLPNLPGAEDLLVLLALHAAFQHGLVLSLVQWLDFRRLQQQSRPAAALVESIARAAGAGAALDAALTAAEATVGAERAPARHAAGPLLRAWLGRRARDPLGFVTPARPALAWMRLAVTPGRRRTLVALTLRPPRPAGIWPATSAEPGRA